MSLPSESSDRACFGSRSAEASEGAAALRERERVAFGFVSAADAPEESVDEPLAEGAMTGGPAGAEARLETRAGFSGAGAGAWKITALGDVTLSSLKAGTSSLRKRPHAIPCVLFGRHSR